MSRRITRNKQSVAGPSESATTLLALPAALLDNIAFRAVQLGAGDALSLTCRAFSKANLLHAPAFRIPLDSQSFSQLLTARFLATLRARTTKLDLSLHQRTAGSGNYINQLAAVLARLGVCSSVDACKLTSISAVRHACSPSLSGEEDVDSDEDSDSDDDSDSDSYGQAIYGGGDSDCGSDLDFPTTVDLDCSPNIAQCLLASFPGLAALSIHGYSVTCSGLASLLSYPQLALQLQQLDLSDTTIEEPEQPEQPGAVPPDSLFRGIRLKQLSLYIGDWNHRDGVPYLQGLPPDLEVLTIQGLSCTSGLLELLLPALPRLHTLHLPSADLSTQQDLDALLATTQLTSLQLKSVNCLTESRVERACSWQRLEVTGTLDYISAAYLPLHSLTLPLLVSKLRFSNWRDADQEHDKCCDYEDRGDVSEVVAAAVHNLTQACRVPVKIKVLHLGIDSIHVSTPPPEWARQVNGAGPLLSLVRPLAGRLEKVVFFKMYGLSAADVPAMARLCKGCTALEFCAGNMRPSLKFWSKLVQSMPTVTHVMLRRVYGSCFLAMFKALDQLDKERWAQHLAVTIVPHHDQLLHEDRLERAECKASNRLYRRVVPGRFRVWFRVEQ